MKFVNNTGYRDQKEIYLPYLIGLDSPIPYLFEGMIPYITEEYPVRVHSTDGSSFDSERVNEIKTNPDSKLAKVIAHLRSSLRPTDLIHTGAGGRLHLSIARVSGLRSSECSHVHTFRVDVDPERWNPEIRRATADRADIVTAVSNHTARTVQREFDVSPHVIHNAVDTELFTPERGNSEILRDLDVVGGVFIFVGYFDRRKRPLDVVDVASERPEFDFIMVGEGPLHEEASRTAKNLDNVHIVGRMNKRKLPDLYADATCLIFPSVMEGCPNVVLEALASGTPIIGYEATSMPELVNDGRTGRLVKEGDTSALAQAASEIYENSDDAMGTRARKYVIENHTFDTIAKQYMAVYDELLSN
jgi:glycosyltransferase involved in cell wall biosynthesis